MPVEISIEPAARLFIAHGARVNAVDSGGRNALHGAVSGRDLSLAAVLLVAGIDVNARDAEGRTPLDYAVTLGDEAMVSLLQQRGGVSGAGRQGHARSPPSRQ